MDIFNYSPNDFSTFSDVRKKKIKELTEYIEKLEREHPFTRIEEIEVNKNLLEQTIKGGFFHPKKTDELREINLIKIFTAKEKSRAQYLQKKLGRELTYSELQKIRRHY